MNDKLDIDSAAHHLSNFLMSCRTEMQLALQAMGKQSVSELGRDDLVAMERDLAEFANIRFGGSHRLPQTERIGKSTSFDVSSLTSASLQ